MTTVARIGVLHPGDMGSAVAATLVERGHEVLWLPEGRSAATRRRADDAGLTAATDLPELMARCEIILSICPPAAALEVAWSIRGFDGLFVDANAIAPATSREIAAAVAGRHVNASIIGPPPITAGTTRLYLCGPLAEEVASVFSETRIQARVLDGPDPTAASAIKMVYAAWTKGSAAMMIAIAEAAEALDVGDALAAEWAMSGPGLSERLDSARRSAAAKGWRWEAEMHEIALTFAAAGQPAGFHEAAAEIFARQPRPQPDGNPATG